MNISKIPTYFFFFFEVVLTLISSLIFGLTYREIPSLSAITQGQAQILFVSALLFLVGFVGLIHILLYFDEGE